MVKNKKYILIILMLLLTGCAESSDYVHKNELKTYEVVSVYQYMKVYTNNFGKIKRQELAYCFTYIGDDGQLHEFEDFHHTEYGLWKVCIGDRNEYVVKEEFLDTYRWLYLTEDTLKNMKFVN